MSGGVSNQATKEHPRDPRRQLLLPDFVVFDALVEIVVVDAQEPGLLQVRRGNPPAPLLVAINAVLEHVPQRLVGPTPGTTPDVWISCVLLHRQSERLENRGGQRVVAQPIYAFAPDSLM